MITAEDESLHGVGPAPTWQESFYFNWATPETFTLARTGYRFHPRKIDGLAISLHKGDLELFYAPADLDHEGPCEAEDPAVGMRAADLVVTMEEPLKRWRLQIEGDRGMDVVFESHSPAFDYHRDGARLASTMTGSHFEQSGVVTGWTHFGKERRAVHAFGQRDKSWGTRDWDRLEGWDWISGQFGPDLSFNLMRTIESGAPLDNGFVFRDGATHPITASRIEWVWDEPERMRSAEIELVEESGRRHHVQAKRIGSFPILRRDVWLEETHVAYTLTSENLRREGQGIVEHVWRATPEQIRERKDRLEPVRRALRPV